MKISIEGNPNDIAVLAAVWAVYTASNSDDCTDAIGVTLDFVRLLASTMRGLYRSPNGDNGLLRPGVDLTDVQRRIALRLHELTESDWENIDDAVTNPE